MKLREYVLKILSKAVMYKKIKFPVVYMTLLVKNEEDILEENLLFHKYMGIDGFIITDNGSSDRTGDIIKKYVLKGWIKEVIYDDSPGYLQTMHVDRMIRIARDKFHCDWIINCDADEFWYCTKRKYRRILCDTGHNVLLCRIYNMLPSENEAFWKSPWRIVKSADKEKYGLLDYNLYTEQISKVIHRGKGYKQIAAGNHNIKMLVKSIGYTEDIVIYHYNVRSQEHFIRKMVGGGAELEKRPVKNMGQHWKYFFDLSNKEDFDEAKAYDAYIGRKVVETFKQENIIMKDETISDIMKKIYSQVNKYEK